MGIEVVYYRFGHPYVESFESIGEALGFIEFGTDDGGMWSAGIFSDGEPLTYSGYVEDGVPSSAEAKIMREAYTKAKATEEE